ncbi:MAG: hypothetical protein PVJ21_09365 [Anaerolineales bacterium]|jgi:hypothetical protein
MRRPYKLFTLSAMLMLVACNAPTEVSQPTDVPTKKVLLTNDSPAEINPQEMFISIGGREQARDAVVAHVADITNLSLPTGEWNFQDQTPQNPDEGFTRLFTKGPWVVQVSAPASSTEPMEYSVVVDNVSAIIRWEGRVDSYGIIVETNFIQGTQPESPEKAEESSWIGVIISNLPGSQFEDYFQAMDQNGTRYGIDGADDAIKRKLIFYRDTGTAVQVWGILQKDIPDAYGAQILVTRIEPY